MAIRLFCDDDPNVVKKALESLTPESKIISIYGLNGRHVAWAEVPEPKKEPILIKKKGK